MKSAFNEEEEEESSQTRKRKKCKSPLERGQATAKQEALCSKYIDQVYRNEISIRATK